MAFLPPPPTRPSHDPQTRREPRLDAVRQTRPKLRVMVTGGGPVGLSFALTLKDLLGASAEITVFDDRWMMRAGTVGWKGREQGNRRREQVVTIQSGVSKDLPRAVENALFGAGDSSVMWPYGRDSPPQYGRPRNVRIRHIEDGLLELARYSDIHLVPERYRPASAQNLECDVLAICDGANSSTRDHFASAFGTPDPTPYCIDGRPVEDVILSLDVTSSLPSATAVVLTVAQNRFLLNTLHGRGVLNVRLTPEEVGELRMMDMEQREVPGCLAGHGCALTGVESATGRAYVCFAHRAALRTAMDPASSLWPRIREGLALFGIAEADVQGIRVFRASMTHRSKFTAELAPASADRPGTFGFLLGDAAGPLHVWPGRGLNYGLSSGVSLARCLQEHWTGGSLRYADFAKHEANMHMLQHRHKDRAWKAMIRFDRHGHAKPIADAIGDSLDAGGRRDEAVADAMDRISQVETRLQGRMEPLPDLRTVRERIESVSDETLRVLVGSGGWDTLGSGGEEVDVTKLYEHH